MADFNVAEGARPSDVATAPGDQSPKSRTACRKRKADIMLLANQSTVIFIVGMERTTFAVHENILKTLLPHFVRHLDRNSGFKESFTNKIEIPDISAETFGFIVRWLYGHGIPKTIGVNDVTGEKSLHEIMHCAEMWRCTDLSTATFEQIKSHHRSNQRPVRPELVSLGLSNLPEYSRFQNWLFSMAGIWCRIMPSYKHAMVQEAKKDEKMFREFMENLLDGILRADTLVDAHIRARSLAHPQQPHLIRGRPAKKARQEATAQDSKLTLQFCLNMAQWDLLKEKRNASDDDDNDPEAATAGQEQKQEDEQSTLFVSP